MIALALVLSGFAFGYLIMSIMVVSGRCARDEELEADIAAAVTKWSGR